MKGSKVSLKRRLEVAMKAAERASQIIMRSFRSDVEVTVKKDGSPVTSADIEAEEAIVGVIRNSFPDDSVIAEEMGSLGSIDREFIWTVDPIDGTKNFSRGIPLFGVQIGILREGVPVAGVSKLPAMGETLSGGQGLGAFLNGEIVKVSPQTDLSKSYISLGGLNHFEDDDLTRGMLSIIRSAARIRSFGDAYPYHLVVTGRFEAVVEAHVRIWDVAALCPILCEAGGKCSQISGEPIGIESENVVFSNGHIHGQLLERLARPDQQSKGHLETL